MNMNFFLRISLFLTLLAAIAAGSPAADPDKMDFYEPDGRVSLVLDPDGLLSPAVKRQLTDSLTALRLRSTAEVEVAVVDNLEGMTPQQWCERLFTRMKLGKEKEDNGLLIMISPGDRKAFIMTGYGMEGVFTDLVCKNISEKDIQPAMQEGDLEGALTRSLSTVSRIIGDPENAREISSAQKENILGEGSGIDGSTVRTFLCWLAAIVFLISGGSFFTLLYRTRRLSTNYEKALSWRNAIPGECLFAVLSLGASLVFLILTVIMYRYQRTRKVVCPTCGSKMHRLSEDEDNEFLTPSQDFEEQLNTIDYDVWKCDSCGTLERFPFRVSQNKYTECPVCHTVALGLESDTIVRPSTTRTEGEGVRTYVCRYCNHHDRRPYRIPRKADNSALAAAAIGAAAASRGRSGGGGGGGFGGFGGFGGGATGGGGAGTSW